MADGDPFPSVAEGEAQGETAAIYEDIRRTLQVPLVNLVWRSLAAVPGALPWAWQSVRSLHVSGRGEGAAAALEAQLVLPEVRAISCEALREHGVGAAAERQIRRTLAAYGRANLINAVTFAALRAMPIGNDEVPPPGAVVVAEGASVPGEPLPALVAVEAMAPPVAEQVRQVSALGCDAQERGPRLQVSLPRQLAHWPGFLHLWLRSFEDAEADGSLRHAVGVAVGAVKVRGEALAAGERSYRPPPDPAHQGEAQAIVDAIVPGPIGRMLVLGRALEKALGAPPHHP